MKARSGKSTEDELPVQFFRALLNDQGTLSRNVMRAGQDKATEFVMLTRATPLQQKAFALPGGSPNLKGCNVKKRRTDLSATIFWLLFFWKFELKKRESPIGCHDAREGGGVRGPVKSIAGFILLLVCMGVFLWPTPSWGDWTLVAPETYIVGIPRDYVLAWAHPRHLGRQQESNWCWAASVQMVLNFAHVPVTQDQIVTRVFGRQVNEPANVFQIMQAIDGWSSFYEGKKIVVKAFLEPSPEQILQDLYLNYPVILALKIGNKIGHAVVITAAKYKVVNGKKQIDYFLVRDPWPKNPSSARLESKSFKDIIGAIGVRISLEKAS